MLNQVVKDNALGKLRTARMQHTKWVTEVLHNRNPQVVEDHTQCEFGKWMISVRDTLEDLEEF